MNGHHRIGHSENGPATEEHRVATARGDFLLTMRFADRDRIGCLLDALEITAIGGGPFRLDAVRCARALAYLEGGLSVVELERSGKRAVLRSTIPRTGGGVIRFVELAIDPARGLSLGQYVYDESTAERKRVPLAVTRDTMSRVSDDLTRLIERQE
jgi:hypothetical protein